MMRSLLPVLGCVLIASCTTNPDGTQSVNKTAVGAAVGAGVGYMMDRQERELREQLASERAANEVQVERVRDDLLKLTLENEVSFDFDSATVRPAFEPTIDKLATVLAKYDRNMVTIVGHTDSTGADGYNESLSLRRAESVLQELSVRGVPRSRMSALGRGESEPRASNANEAGRQLNRRVEILVQPVA